MGVRALRYACLPIVAGLLACPCFGQDATGALVNTKLEQLDVENLGSTLEYPRGEFIDYRLSTGSFDNPGSDYVLGFEDAIVVEGAAWIRVYFSEVNLGQGPLASDRSFIRIISAKDGEIQELDAETMRLWSNSSAYFNGDTLYVEFVAAPGSTDNRFEITQVAADFPPPQQVAAPCGICDPDDRVPSAINAFCRVMPVGCSATVWNQDSCLVSAGHCFGNNQVAQFNVPASDGACNPINPPVADQFPILVWNSVNGGVGNDWAVMTTGPNNLGQKAFQRYGLLRNIAGPAANVGDNLVNHGYGIEDPAGGQCTRSQTQQTHNGPVIAVNATYYDFRIDITFGNSGSSVLKNNEIVGIVTHCRTSCPNLNIATRHDHPQFAAARLALCGQQQGEGACCLPSGQCVVVTRSECADRGGAYQGDGTSCRQGLCDDCVTGNILWDNNLVTNGLNGRALSPPTFPNIRVADDFVVPRGGWLVQDFHVNVIEDATWAPGPVVEVYVRDHDPGTGGPRPGVGNDRVNVTGGYTRQATGAAYFGRDDYNYCILFGSNSFALPTGRFWIGLRNPQGGLAPCDWDNNITSNGINGRAVSPPSFPNIRVVDDFVTAGPCTVNTMEANVIEDSTWTPGSQVTVYVYNNSGGAPTTLLTSATVGFTRLDLGTAYFGRQDYKYTMNGLGIAKPAGTHWFGLRNPGGGGTGTNYWMTSDGGPNGMGSSTGYFSLDGGTTWTAEGATWHHSFVFRGQTTGSGTNYWMTSDGGPSGMGSNTGYFSLDAGGSWTPEGDTWHHAFLVTGSELDPDGACCCDEECLITTREECDALGGCLRDPEWRCDGDVDGNGVVNPVDVGLIQAAFGSQDPDDLCQYDVDCNGAINPVDAGIVQSLFGQCRTPRPPCGGGQECRWLGPDTDCDPNPCQQGSGRGACCFADPACDWDNNVGTNGVNGRALSPPSFPNIRVVDDFRTDGCTLNSMEANVIEDTGWTPGNNITVYVYNSSGSAPTTFRTSSTVGFTRQSLGTQYFARDDYKYTMNGLGIPVPAGQFWIGMRNAGGGGSGTNYWMTSDGGPNGMGTSTGYFSLDAGTTWQPEGAGWQHAFVVRGGASGGCGWDNNTTSNGVNGRALSPPSFPNIRVADDFTVPTGGCTVKSMVANVIEDAGWTPGAVVQVYLHANSGGAPGARLAQRDVCFLRRDLGTSYFGRQDYEYTMPEVNVTLAAGTYWIGLRNPGGGGAGTNYWMTSDGGPDGMGSSTGYFSLDAGTTWQPEGAGWQHAFRLDPVGCVDGTTRDECAVCGGTWTEDARCDEVCVFDCVGADCGNFIECGPGGSCVCASIFEFGVGGPGVCVDGATQCANLTQCPGGSGDCVAEPGGVCAIDTCCGVPVCLYPRHYRDCSQGLLPEPRDIPPGEILLGYRGDE